MPKEQSRFKGVDRDFRDIMADIYKDVRVVSLVQQKDVGTALKNMLDQLQRCQKSLNEFLEVILFIFTLNLFLIIAFSIGKTINFPKILLYW